VKPWTNRSKIIISLFIYLFFIKMILTQPTWQLPSNQTEQAVTE